MAQRNARLTVVAAREELNRRATPKDHRGRWILHVEGQHAEDEVLARKSQNSTLKAKAGNFTPTARDDAWVKTHAPAESSKPLGSKADRQTTDAAQIAFAEAFKQASQCRQYAGKLAAGYVAHQGMSVLDAVAAAVEKANAYIRKADRVNA